MPKCKQIQCLSYLLGNPSNEYNWLLKDQQLSLRSLAIEMTHYFPLHGYHQMPEAKINIGVSFKVYHLQGLFIRCQKATVKIIKKQCGVLYLKKGHVDDFQYIEGSKVRNGQ